MNVIIERFKSSSPTLKTAILAVAAIWLIAVGTIVSSLFILWQKPIAAEPPPFDQVNPAIRLDPTTGAANTPLTVNGEGWQPGDLVTIYLAAPGQPDTSGYILGSTMVDEQGQFTISTTLPAGNEWQGVDRVIARTTTGEMSAQAFLQFAGTGETATPTATATNTVETTSTTATATGVVQTATATPTSQPGVPLVVTATDLNVRSGPGTNYSVLGLLKAGQSAEITGVSPDRQWWQIRFGGAADGRGWLAARYVTAQNTANVPVVQPPPAPVTPTPTPTTVVITDWRG
jgi:uncharacterized protein YraI